MPRTMSALTLGVSGCVQCQTAYSMGIMDLLLVKIFMSQFDIILKEGVRFMFFSKWQLVLNSQEMHF